MTDLLKDVMNERAGTVPDLPLDLYGVIRAGDRRTRRRRTLGVITAAALTTAVIATGVSVLRSPDTDHTAGRVDPSAGPISLRTVPGPAAPLRFSADKPTWADGEYIHYGDQRVAIPADGVWAFVKTDAALVYMNRHGEVVVTDGRAAEVVGWASSFRLAAGETGTLVAWADSDQEKQFSELVVYDTQRRYQVLRTRTAGESSPDGSHELTVTDVLGMDGDALYLATEHGQVVRRGLTTGTTRLVPGDPMTWHDAAASKIVHDRRRGSKAVVIGTDLSGTQPAVLATRADLSPSARSVATDFDNRTRIYDVASLTERPLAHPSHPVISPAQWLDDDRLVTVGYRTTTEKLTDPVDLLVCTVSAGTCTTLARDVARYANAISYFDSGDPDRWRLAFPTGRNVRY